MMAENKASPCHLHLDHFFFGYPVITSIKLVAVSAFNNRNEKRIRGSGGEKSDNNENLVSFIDAIVITPFEWREIGAVAG